MNGYRFDNRVVLITGAAGGVGSGLCQYFDQRGATVLALGRDRDSSQYVANLVGGACVPVAADVTDRELTRVAIDVAVKSTGPVDILINNAGAAAATTLSKLTPADWQADIDLNLSGAYHCVEAVKDAMFEERRGVIINIGTVNASLALGHPAYSAAKAGLISYTKSLAMEYGPMGIRANLLNLGTIRTQAWNDRVAKQPEIFEHLKKWYPLRNFAEPRDVATFAAFLASDDARFITGAIIPVDGGLTAGNPVLAAELTQEQF